MSFKVRVTAALRALEPYTRTDMLYLLRGGFWINLSSVTVSIFSLVLYFVFARYLPQQVYGTYQYLLSLSAVAGAFTLTGMNSALTRSVARGYEGTVNASISFQLRWGLLPLLGSWAAGSYYLLHGNLTMGIGLFLIGIFVPLNNALNSYGTWLSGRQDFRSGFLFNFCTNLLYYPALIVAAFFSRAALLLLAVNLVTQAIALAICYRAAQRRIKPNESIDQDAFTYGSHLSAMGILSTLANQLDNILAFHTLGAVPVALYNFATAVPDRVNGLVKFIPASALPKFALRSAPELRKSLGTRMLWAIAGSSIVTLVYIVLARTVFATLFPNYIDAVPYSMVYAVTIVCSLIAVYSSALTALGETRTLYSLTLFSALFQSLLIIVGVYTYGLWGLVAARIAGAAAQFAASAFLFYRITARARTSSII